MQHLYDWHLHVLLFPLQKIKERERKMILVPDEFTETEKRANNATLSGSPQAHSNLYHIG